MGTMKSSWYFFGTTERERTVSDLTAQLAARSLSLEVYAPIVRRGLIIGRQRACLTAPLRGSVLYLLERGGAQRALRLTVHRPTPRLRAWYETLELDDVPAARCLSLVASAEACDAPETTSRYAALAQPVLAALGELYPEGLAAHSRGADTVRVHGVGSMAASHSRAPRQGTEDVRSETSDRHAEPEGCRADQGYRQVVGLAASSRRRLGRRLLRGLLSAVRLDRRLRASTAAG